MISVSESTCLTFDATSFSVPIGSASSFRILAPQTRHTPSATEWRFSSLASISRVHPSLWNRQSALRRRTRRLASFRLHQLQGFLEEVSRVRKQVNSLVGYDLRGDYGYCPIQRASILIYLVLWLACLSDITAESVNLQGHVFDLRSRVPRGREKCMHKTYPDDSAA